MKEKEGITLILRKEDADKEHLSYEKIWAHITLAVHSNLAAIGFLARITQQLAEAHIPVNAVSAYYHDYLFVPTHKAKQAMETLTKLSDTYIVTLKGAKRGFI